MNDAPRMRHRSRDHEQQHSRDQAQVRCPEHLQRSDSPHIPFVSEQRRTKQAEHSHTLNPQNALSAPFPRLAPIQPFGDAETECEDREKSEEFAHIRMNNSFSGTDNSLGIVLLSMDLRRDTRSALPTRLPQPSRVGKERSAARWATYGKRYHCERQIHRHVHEHPARDAMFSRCAGQDLDGRSHREP